MMLTDHEMGLTTLKATQIHTQLSNATREQ